MDFKNDKGFKCYEDLKSFKSSFSIFNLNYYELKKVSQRQEYSNLLDFPSLKRWRLQNILIKNVFNTITSSLAYLEHIKQKVKGNAVLRNLIKDDVEIYCFYRSLRNYLVHQSTFALISRQNHNGISIENVYHTFDTRIFAEYLISRKTNFDDIALSFLKSLPEKTNFFKLLEGLKTWINTIHMMVTIEFVKIHCKSLQVFLIGVNKFYDQHNIFYPINKVQARHLSILLNIATRKN